jgi:hypothetical protein
VPARSGKPTFSGFVPKDLHVRVRGTYDMINQTGIQSDL